MLKKTNVFILVGFLLVAMLGVGIFVKSPMEGELIKIYKATPFSQQNTRGTKASATSSVSEPTEDKHPVLTSGKDYDNSLMSSHTSDLMSEEKVTEESEIDLSFFEEMEEPLGNESPGEDSADESVNTETWLAEQIESLTRQLSEKYPELAELGHMSLAEINALYPTPEDKEALAQLSLRAQAEFIADFRILFSKVPPEIMEESFAILQEMFTERWGNETADKVITVLRAHLDL